MSISSLQGGSGGGGSVIDKEWVNDSWRTDSTTELKGSVVLLYPNTGSVSSLSNGSGYYESVYGSRQVSQPFKYGYSKWLTSIRFLAYRVASSGGDYPNGDCIIQIRSAIGGTVLSEQKVRVDLFSTSSNNYLNVFLDNPVYAPGGTTYYIVILSPDTTNGGYYQFGWGSNTTTDNNNAGEMKYSTDGGVSWVDPSGNFGDLNTNFVYHDSSTKGYAYKTIYSPLIKKWNKFTFSKTVPTNTTLTIDILDKNSNVLLSNVSSGVDLSSIDPKTHTVLIIRALITKSTSDLQTPKIYNWNLNYSEIVSGTNTDNSTGLLGGYNIGSSANHHANIVLDIIGSGYVTGITNIYDPNNSAYTKSIAIEVDGSSDIQTTTSGVWGGTSIPLNIRFNSRVKVTSDSNYFIASYILD